MANAMHTEFPKCSKKDCPLAVEMSGGDVRRTLESVKTFYNDHGMTVPGAKKLAAIAARFEKKSDEERDAEPEDCAALWRRDELKDAAPLRGLVLRRRAGQEIRRHM
ncbi:hypothetical protein AURDEDRAFT_172648 [Auricularia subglabra TFB-10046 SS5]|nr:hypothetical protein AURDEDRAFT_172648 [Auricularia subglabra TFB-10046 SS5]